MIKRTLANTMAKKTSVFVAVFAITCILMGSKLGMDMESQLVQAATTVRSHQERISTVSVTAPDASVEELYALPYVSGEYPTPGAEPRFGRGEGIQAVPMVVNNIPKTDGFIYSSEIPLSRDLQQYTYNQCVAEGLEYELVLALMWRESRFQIDAVNINSNGTQDSGIMQINDVNKGWLQTQHGITDLMDPMQNITAGTTILGDFNRKFGAHDALMAYQYGENGMAEKQEQGIVTNDKIALLLDKREDFRSLLHNA